MAAPGAPRFINVDLELWSRTDLSAYAKAVEDKAFVLYAGKVRRKNLVSLEARVTGAAAESPEGTIRALLRLIASLPPAARRAWKQADSRVFNVGYETGDLVTLLEQRPPGTGAWYAKDPTKAARALETSLGPELLGAVARVGGTITTTIYPLTKETKATKPARVAPRAAKQP